jgi:hypothetical protein
MPVSSTTTSQLGIKGWDTGLLWLCETRPQTRASPQVGTYRATHNAQLPIGAASFWQWYAQLQTQQQTSASVESGCAGSFPFACPLLLESVWNRVWDLDPHRVCLSAHVRA